MAVFGTFFIFGKIKTDVKPNNWAYINTVICYVATALMLYIVFYL